MGSKKDERIGMRRVNNQGLVAEIIEYTSWKEMLVRFDDGTTISTRWDHFTTGLFRNPNVPFDKSLRKERVGEEAVNKQGCHMKIVEYQNAENVMVQFDNGPNQIIKTSYDNFKKGKTHNPFANTRYGIGNTGNNFNYKDKEFQTWCGILERCYSNNQKRKSWPYYKDCTVCDEFLYYPNFLNWIKSQENYETWKNNTDFHVDKDILCKGNKEYSPEKCCLVPGRVNNLVRNVTGSNRYPGVRQIRLSGKYSAECKDAFLHKNIYIGTFDSEYEAFVAYKKYEEDVIKKVAEKEYADGMISKQCRDALLRYEIDETD